MNVLILSIGSNINSDENMYLCEEILSHLFPNIIYSETIETDPYGSIYKNNFKNKLAFIKCTETLNSINLILKFVEKKIGRTKEEKDKGIVKIDIDIVKFNDEIIKPKDWERSYVQNLLESLYDKIKMGL